MLVSFVFIFSGCNLWTLNKQKMLNQTAAKISDITVTYEDVYNAYYSYGNYYFDNQGDPTYDGMKQTATQLVNREVLLKALKEKGGDYYTKLNTKQSNEVWNSLYENINTSLYNYQKSIMEIDGKNIKSLDTDDDEEEEKTGYEKEYTAYEKTYKYDLDEATGEYVLTKIEKPEELITQSVDVFQFTPEEMVGFEDLEQKLASMTLEAKADRAFNNFKTKFWNRKDDLDKNAKGEYYCELAFNKLISVLKSNETDKTLNMEAKYVFYRFLDETFEELYNSKLITAFQENYEKTQSISSELVLSTFNNLAKAQNEKYRNSYDDYSSFVGAMKSRSEPMLYFEKTNEWFQVSHILLKYDSSDVDKLKQLQTDYKNGKFASKEVYEQKVMEVKNAIKFTDRKDGQKYSAQEVLAMLRSAMGISINNAGKVTYSTSVSAEQRIQAFNDFIYRFNMDDGANNAELAYYIPKDGKYDSMVTPFANASRDLHESGIVGSISDLIEIDEIFGYEDNDGNIQTPGYSGEHIIIYLGEIQTLNTNQTVSLSDLNSYVLNPLNNNLTNQKTMLDYVIEKISIDNYNAYQSSVLQKLKKDNEIVYYDNILKDLVKAFSK